MAKKLKINEKAAHYAKDAHDLKPVFHLLGLMNKKLDNLAAPLGGGAGGCTLNTKQKVEAVVIAALQIRFPSQPIQTTTKLDDDLGMDSDAAATLLPGMMMDAVEGYGCHSRLGSDDYGAMKTVQGIIDAIWSDLQDH
jgi:hypothetical protein